MIDLDSPPFSPPSLFYEHIPDVLKICHQFGVEVVSGYAWSTENWGRPKLEVEFILKALEKRLPRFIKELHDRKIRFIHSGFTHNLSAKACKRLDEATTLTQHNTNGVFNLAINYGVVPKSSMLFASYLPTHLLLKLYR